MLSNVYVYADYRCVIASRNSYFDMAILLACFFTFDSPAKSPEVEAMRLPALLAGPYDSKQRHRIGSGNGWGVCAMAYGTHAFTSPLIDLWQNNTCIAQSSQKFFDFNGCDASHPTDGMCSNYSKIFQLICHSSSAFVLSGNIPDLSGNTYLSLDGGYSMKCDASHIWTLSEAQAVGVDTGSVASVAPSVDALVALGHAQLGF